MSQGTELPTVVALVVHRGNLATFASVPERRAQETDGTPMLIELTALLRQFQAADPTEVIEDLRGHPAFVELQDAIDDRTWQIAGRRVRLSPRPRVAARAHRAVRGGAPRGRRHPDPRSLGRSGPDLSRGSPIRPARSTASPCRKPFGLLSLFVSFSAPCLA